MSETNLEKATQDSRTFWDSMAAGWERAADDTWERTKHVSERMVERLDPKPGDVVLEIATGSGETAFLVAERVAPGGRVIATDFSEEMLAIARRRAERFGARDVEYRVLDAQRIDLDDDSVDHVMARFGLMLVPDPVTAVRGIRRVLRRGGRLVFAVWGAIERNAWALNLGVTAEECWGLPRPDPVAPGGMFSMADSALIGDLLAGAGLDLLSAEEIPVRFDHESFDAMWDHYVDLFSWLRAAMDEHAPEEVEAFRERLRARVEPFTGPSGIEMSGAALVYTAS